MASTSSWVFQVPIFEKIGYRIILHDFRGQLKSDKPLGPYSFKDHVDDLKLLMEHLNIKKAHLIGTSYGGEVAMKFAISYPEYVNTISIIDSVSELDEVLESFVNLWKILAQDKAGEKFFYGMMPTIYHQEFIKNNLEMLKKRAQAMNLLPSDYFDGQIALYDTFIKDVNMTHELHKISCPTLVVCGEDDILKPRKFSDIIANNIKTSEYVLIPKCAHVTIFEKPDTLNTILLGFVLKNS